MVKKVIIARAGLEREIQLVAFTGATALSPADTFPLTRRAKLLMMAEAILSLVIIVLLAARAVNILGS